MDNNDKPPMEEEKVTAEVRNEAWQAYFAKRKIRLLGLAIYLIAAVAWMFWNIGFRGPVALMAYPGVAITMSWAVLIFIIGDFCKFHGIARSVFPLGEHKFVKGAFAPKQLKWILYSLDILLLLWLIAFFLLFHPSFGVIQY